MPAKRMKDLFYQEAQEGVIPSHWVVQYYIEGEGFPRAEYFQGRLEAIEFIRQEFGEQAVSYYE